MYPVIRLIAQLVKHRKDPPMPVTGTHVSHHMCLPWDIDIWMELNNGRTLTLYDLGRTSAAQRAGLVRVLRKNRWGLTMAGASVRYRRRIRTFERIEMRSRLAWWDDKIFLCRTIDVEKERRMRQPHHLSLCRDQQSGDRRATLRRRCN